MIHLRKKTLYKSISWRVISIIQSMAMSYWFLESFTEAGKFTLVSAVIGTFLYYLHEEFYRHLRKKGKL